MHARTFESVERRLVDLLSNGNLHSMLDTYSKSLKHPVWNRSQGKRHGDRTADVLPMGLIDESIEER